MGPIQESKIHNNFRTIYLYTGFPDKTKGSEFRFAISRHYDSYEFKRIAKHYNNRY